ncbi:hypothetical protein GGF31_001385 [Allomyces arbusculus]|nr:hypothetical protein GGF31_001385 [Allomyces arbusculus]
MHAIPAMFATSFYGQLSDNPRIVLPALGYISCLSNIYIVDGFNQSSWYLIPGNLLLGLSGELSTFLMAIFAMTADLIPTPNRIFFFVITEMTFMTGMKVGPLIMSAMVARAPDMPLLPIGVGIGLMAFAIVFTLIFAPSASKAQELHAEGGDHGQQCLCTSAQATLLVPYAYRRFGWTSKEDGYYQAAAFFAKVLVMIAFLPFAHKAKNRWRSQSQEQSQPQEQQPLQSNAFYMGAALWAIALALSLAVERKDLAVHGPDAVVAKFETEKSMQDEVALNEVQ